MQQYIRYHNKWRPKREALIEIHNKWRAQRKGSDKIRAPIKTKKSRISNVGTGKKKQLIIINSKMEKNTNQMELRDGKKIKRKEQEDIETSEVEMESREIQYLMQ